MVKFFKEDDFKIHMNNEHYITLEMKTHDDVLHALAARKWKLYVTHETNGYFVTSDRPVVLTWNNPQEIPVMMRHSPGFGMTGTELLFPIIKDLLLIGSFEQEDAILPAEPLLVAAANAKMIAYSFGQVYAHKKTFPYCTPDMKFYHDKLFMDRHKPWRKKPPEQTELVK